MRAQEYPPEGNVHVKSHGHKHLLFSSVFHNMLICFWKLAQRLLERNMRYFITCSDVLLSTTSFSWPTDFKPCCCVAYKHCSVASVEWNTLNFSRIYVTKLRVSLLWIDFWHTQTVRNLKNSFHNLQWISR